MGLEKRRAYSKFRQLRLQLQDAQSTPTLFVHLKRPPLHLSLLPYERFAVLHQGRFYLFADRKKGDRGGEREMRMYMYNQQ